MILPGAASMNGFSVRSGQSTTLTDDDLKLFCMPVVNTVRKSHKILALSNKKQQFKFLSQFPNYCYITFVLKEALRADNFVPNLTKKRGHRVQVQRTKMERSQVVKLERLSKMNTLKCYAHINTIKCDVQGKSQRMTSQSSWNCRLFVCC